MMFWLLNFFSFPSKNPIFPRVHFPPLSLTSPEFILSSAVLAISIGASIYFFLEWRRHGYKFLLYWSFGFLGIYLFQIPAIMANAGFNFTLSYFNNFYSAAFPLAFAGLVAIYYGVRAMGLRSPGKTKKIFIAAWIAASLIIIAGYTFLFGKHPDNYFLDFLTVFFFFVPIYLMNLFALAEWRKSWKKISTKIINAGITFMAAGILIGLLETFLALREILIYPPQLWFIAVAFSRPMFFLQSIELMLLIAGFLFTHYGFKTMDPADIEKIAEENKSALDFYFSVFKKP